jgi:hypothetical protein
MTYIQAFLCRHSMRSGHDNGWQTDGTALRYRGAIVATWSGDGTKILCTGVVGTGALLNEFLSTLRERPAWQHPLAKRARPFTIYPLYEFADE